MIPSVMPTYARLDVVFEHGEGPWLVATDGRRFLDFAAGIAVCSLGHCHPVAVAALKAQAEKLWHCSNLYRIAGQEELSKRLVETTFADTVFFGNSGAEAVECAIKVARHFQFDQGRPERYRVLVMTHAFHGRTLATVAAGDQAKGKHGFGPQMDGFDRVPFGDIEAAKAAVGPETAAILLEPVQGEGGMVAAEFGYLRALRKLADENGLLLLFDEVQCGVGRTGKLFAHEWSGVAPDVMAVAKGLGGGFPVGACLATERAAKGMVAGTHGSTFGGNPLAMAAANAVYGEITAPGFLDRVNAVAGVLRRALADRVQRYPEIFEEIRGLGLMAGLKCRVANTDLVNRLFEEGLLAVPAGDNTLRFVPPLIIDEGHVEAAMAKLDRVCEAWSEKS
ncbi:MAG: aspartate aminotransferase family protein [Rhodospirillaceae bacterium]